MNKKEIKSFQENIRKTFILYSLTPVIAITMVAMVLFIAIWFINVKNTTSYENSQITSQIDSTMEKYSNILDSADKNIGTQNVFLLRNKLYSLIYENTSEFDDIGDFMILTNTLDVVFSSKDTSYRFLTNRDFINWGVLKAAQTHPGEICTVLYSDKLCLVKGVETDGHLSYYLIYVVPKDVIQQFVSSDEKMVCITDSAGWSYALNNKNLVDDLGQIKSELENNNGIITIDKHRYYSVYSQSANGLKIYTVSDIHRSLRLIEILILILAVIFIFIIVISYKNAGKSSVEYTKDVKKIEDAFEAVQQGDFDVSLNIDSSKELQTIGNDFNEMLAGLKTQIAQNQELAENAAFSQVKQLESQFNPHFLYNTLDNIRFMAKIDAAAADKMIISLSGLLRYSIGGTKEEVTVAEDLQNLQYYLNILQIRFNKRFAYNIDVSKDIYDCLIPKLVVQPLLENAIKYGFGGKEKLTVTIKGYQIQDKIIFSCVDDGVGIEPELLEEIKQQLESDKNISSHLGLYNIHRRIRLMYKGNYGLNISSEKDKGTTVRLTIPKHL